MEREKKVTGLTLLNFKTYYKVIVTISIGVDIKIDKYVDEIE